MTIFARVSCARGNVTITGAGRRACSRAGRGGTGRCRRISIGARGRGGVGTRRRICGRVSSSRSGGAGAGAGGRAGRGTRDSGCVEYARARSRCGTRACAGTRGGRGLLGTIDQVPNPECAGSSEQQYQQPDTDGHASSSSGARSETRRS